jgi:hypothetical protein
MTAKLSPRLPLLFFFLGLLPFSSMAQYSPTQHLLRRKAGGAECGCRVSRQAAGRAPSIQLPPGYCKY